MKHIVVACGAGLATSSIVSQRLVEEMKNRGIDVRVTQVRMAELDGYDGEADALVTTMRVDKKFKTPLVHGSAYLTGLNTESVSDELESILKGD